jgi:hypothetical protein
MLLLICLISFYSYSYKLQPSISIEFVVLYILHFFKDESNIIIINGLKFQFFFVAANVYHHAMLLEIFIAALRLQNVSCLLQHHAHIAMQSYFTVNHVACAAMAEMFLFR